MEELNYISKTWSVLAATTVLGLYYSCPYFFPCCCSVPYLKHCEVRSLGKIKKNRMVEKDSKVVPDRRVFGVPGPWVMRGADECLLDFCLWATHGTPVWTAIEAVSFRANRRHGISWAGVRLCCSPSSRKHHWLCRVERPQPEQTIAAGFLIPSHIYWGLHSLKHFGDNLIHWKGSTLSRLMNQPVSGGVLIENANRGDTRW